MNDRARNIIEDSGLLWRGHFLTGSGKHTEIYWKKYYLLSRPDLLETVCAPIVHRFRDETVDLVVGPTLGGTLIAYEVARQMRRKTLPAERNADGKGRIFRYPSMVESDSRVLLVDDILMTGWTVNSVIDVVRERGATIVGIGVLLDRSQVLLEFPYPLFTVHRIEMPDYEPEDCPLCKVGIPLTRPAGTT